MLPDRSQQERDPWYQWDHPDLRRNWGEPVRNCHVLKIMLWISSSLYLRLFSHMSYDGISDALGL